MVTYRPDIPKAVVEFPPPRRLLSPAERRYLRDSPLETEVVASHLGLQRVRIGNMGPKEGVWWVRW